MTQTPSIAQSTTSSKTRSMAYVALTIAIIAVSAWVVVPIGPIPFTLQMFSITFAIAVLTPRQAMAAIAGYLLLGAAGVPVFSAMRGGIGVFMGPTGGFLWGYLFAVAAAVGLLWLIRNKTPWGKAAFAQLVKGSDTPYAQLSLPQRIHAFLISSGAEVLAGIVFTAIAYVCGWWQYMMLTAVSPLAAFLTACAPFIVLDLIKIVAAVICAQAVTRARLG